MLDHVGFHTRQFAALAQFYEKALRPLGYGKVITFEDAAGFGRDGKPSLWIGAGDASVAGIHVAIMSDDRAKVDAFYAAALAAGGRDNGAPGLRPHYHPNYYAAFVFDPDGNNLEAVCHKPA